MYPLLLPVGIESACIVIVSLFLMISMLRDEYELDDAYEPIVGSMTFLLVVGGGLDFRVTLFTRDRIERRGRMG